MCRPRNIRLHQRRQRHLRSLCGSIHRLRRHQQGMHQRRQQRHWLIVQNHHYLRHIQQMLLLRQRLEPMR
jgi:hypothetical protein